MRGRRVCLVVPIFPRLSETFIVRQLTGLLGAGWDAHVLCARSPAREWSAFPHLAADRSVRRRVHATGRLRRYWFTAPLRVLRPALVHFEFGPLARGRLRAVRRSGARSVVSFRGYDLAFTGLEDPAYYDEVWNHADALHLLGEDLWQRARRRGCPEEKRHALIPPAVDASVYDPGGRRHVDVAGSRRRPLRVLSVARMHWKKGLEHGMEAVARLRAHGVEARWRIVGDGEHRPAIAFARHQLGVEDEVELLGARTPAEVREQMLWADCLLHPAVSEGFGNAALEAQAMRLPVVTTDADGLPENVADGTSGIVVPRRDAAELTDALATLTDPALRDRLGAAGRRRAVERFGTEREIAAFSALYREVLEGRPPTREEARA